MPLLPKNSARTTSEPPLAAGALVMYENDGAPLIAIVGAYRKQKFQLFNQRGREVDLEASRLHLLPGFYRGDLQSQDERTRYLTELAERCTSKAADISLDELWAVTAPESGDEGREYLVRELSELYYNRDSLEEHIALRLALLDDKIFFKRKKEGFSPRAAGVVDELKKAAALREEKIRYQKVLADWCVQRLRAGGAPCPPEAEPMLALLEDVAVEATLDNARAKEAKELLEGLEAMLKLSSEGAREERAFTLLRKIGHFTPHKNLAFVRHRPPLRFSSDALKEAEALPELDASASYLKDEPAGFRRDLRALDTFTVDDPVTLDMDDALSLEFIDGGYRLGVHISDVASFIRPGSALEKEALSRATSIYCPEITVNMLPEILSQQKLSLLRGKTRATLSCLFSADRDFNVTSVEVVPTLIEVKRRLTYDDVAELLERGDPAITAVYSIGMNNEEIRFRRGASKVQKTDIAITVLGDDDFSIREVDEHEPSRNLVAETAVLANAALADFVVKHDLPAVFRGQEPPHNDRPVEGIPAGPALDYAYRARLKKSLTGCAPMPHSSLGLPAYLQGTSPIRRVVDLCNQRQILQFLKTGRGAYSREDLQQIIELTDPALGRATSVSRETKRFWVLRYLQRRATQNAMIRGTVIRTDLKLPIVEVEEVFTPLMVKSPRPVKPGDSVQVKIVAVEPQRDLFRGEIQ